MSLAATGFAGTAGAAGDIVGCCCCFAVASSLAAAAVAGGGGVLFQWRALFLVAE